jgi:hypothetical protein
MARIRGDGGRVPGQEKGPRTRRKLTRGASGSVKASTRHGTHHGGGAATLRRDVEASAAHMTMVARVGSCHRCGSGKELRWVAILSGRFRRKGFGQPEEGRPDLRERIVRGRWKQPRRPGHWSVRA